MPELPDVEAYIHALRQKVQGQTLVRIRLFNPFVLRTFEPPIREASACKVLGLRRMGKRIVFELEGDLFLVFHLMISGRFRWAGPEAKPPGKMGHLALDFPDGTLLLVEASTRKRASLYLVRGEEGLREHERGGLEPLDMSAPDFEMVLKAENRTLKRALTNPRNYSGIGNAFSDEILFEARLSPMRLTSSLSDEEVRRLYLAVQAVLAKWAGILKERFLKKFPGPGEVTAFRPEFAVHGKFGQPCPVCGKKVQRIVYADNETNYCAQCQNEGRLLADRSLSRLLKDDWPKTIQQLED